MTQVKPDVKLAVHAIEDPNQNYYGQLKISAPLNAEAQKSFENSHANFLHTPNSQRPGVLAIMRRLGRTF